MLVEATTSPGSGFSDFDSSASFVLFEARRRDDSVWLKPTQGGLSGIVECLDLIDKCAAADDWEAIESLKHHVDQGDFIKCAMHIVEEAGNYSLHKPWNAFKDVVGELDKVVRLPVSLEAKRKAHEHFRRALNAFAEEKEIPKIRAVNLGDKMNPRYFPFYVAKVDESPEI